MSIFHKEAVQGRNKAIADNIMKSIMMPNETDEVKPLLLTQEVYDEAIYKGIFTDFEDVVDDNIEKGIKDRSHLQKKVVTTKTGKKMTVWVKPAEAKSAGKTLTANGIMQKKELTKEDIASLKDRTHELSHINKVRYDREHAKHFGEQSTKNSKETKETEKKSKDSVKGDDTKGSVGKELGDSVREWAGDGYTDNTISKVVLALKNQGVKEEAFSIKRTANWTPEKETDAIEFAVSNIQSNNKAALKETGYPSGRTSEVIYGLVRAKMNGTKIYDNVVAGKEPAAKQPLALNFGDSDKGKDLKKFLDGFDNNATKWSEATDEIRDIARYAREFYNEIDLEDKAPHKAADFRSFKTPKEWNTKGKQYIQDTFNKMSEGCKAKFLKHVI